MRTRTEMDYIYDDGHGQIVIESIQRDTRKAVIEQYIECRKAQHITQAELARRTGIQQSNITRFESGNYNPSLEMMVRIAAALGMQLSVQLKQCDGRR